MLVGIFSRNRVTSHESKVKGVPLYHSQVWAISALQEKEGRASTSVCGPFQKKLAAALGAGVYLSILSYAGYAPTVEQSETVRMTLRVLYALVPSLFNLLGLGIALFYPISMKAHREILAAIQKRRAGENVQDPLKPERVLAG